MPLKKPHQKADKQSPKPQQTKNANKTNQIFSSYLLVFQSTTYCFKRWFVIVPTFQFSKIKQKYIGRQIIQPWQGIFTQCYFTFGLQFVCDLPTFSVILTLLPKFYLSATIIIDFVSWTFYAHVFTVVLIFDRLMEFLEDGITEIALRK